MDLVKVNNTIIKVLGFLWICSFPIFTAYALVHGLTDN